MPFVGVTRIVVKQILLNVAWYSHRQSLQKTCETKIKDYSFAALRMPIIDRILFTDLTNGNGSRDASP
jgi:hypothetical protein